MNRLKFPVGNTMPKGKDLELRMLSCLFLTVQSETFYRYVRYHTHNLYS